MAYTKLKDSALGPPHTLTMIKLGSCDICYYCKECSKGDSLNLDHIDQASNYGWVYCNCSHCEETFKRDRSDYLLDLTEIKKEIGHPFIVKRTSGALENDWVIIYAMRENGDTKVLVRKYEGNTGVYTDKKVSLRSLKSWQL